MTYCVTVYIGATKSSYQANTQIQQYLTERLAKNNHNTKYKTLMIIKVRCCSFYIFFALTLIYVYSFYLSIFAEPVARNSNEKWDRTSMRLKSVYVSIFSMCPYLQ